MGAVEGGGGSMHLLSNNHNILGTSGIVGSHIPNAVGFAYGKKINGEKGVTCVVFGDGATDAGTFYDSINIALIRKAPVLFILENNELAIRTPNNIRQYEKNILKKVECFGMKVVEPERDIKSMTYEIKSAIERISKNNIPEFIKLNTTRWYQHLGFEYELDKDYRDIENESEILKNDEINLWIKSINESDKNQLNSFIDNKIKNAWNKTQNSSYPLYSTILNYSR